MTRNKQVFALFVVVVIVLLLTVQHMFCATNKAPSVQEWIMKHSPSDTTIMAGVTALDATLPIGTPLAGYNHGKRRVPRWPLPQFGAYTTFMMPSEGVLIPTYAKCLVLKSSNAIPLALVSLDAVGSDGTLLSLAYQKAKEMGFNIPLDNVILSASHTHSGPGAITPEWLWSLAPATDLLVPSLQDTMAQHIADCLVKAYFNMKPVKIGIGNSELTGITENRRGKYSPYLKRDSIDPQLAVIRVDDMASGAPLATVWNYAIHGVCYGPDNMKFTGDIMGRANQIIEEYIPGSVAMFANSDAGDIVPNNNACHGEPDHAGSHVIAKAVTILRNNTQTFDKLDMQVYSKYFDFGPTNMNLTLERIGNCSHGGFLQICTICHFLACDLNLHLGEHWIENRPRFTAVRLDIGGRTNLIVTSPGESLTELGTQVRSDARILGSDLTMIFGYSNSHMGYFATAREYEVGGYESTLTLWGEDTASKIRDCSNIVMNAVMKSSKAPPTSK
jgi:neutral ceramidase